VADEADFTSLSDISPAEDIAVQLPIVTKTIEIANISQIPLSFIFILSLFIPFNIHSDFIEVFHSL